VPGGQAHLPSLVGSMPPVHCGAVETTWHAVSVGVGAVPPVAVGPGVAGALSPIEAQLLNQPCSGAVAGTFTTIVYLLCSPGSRRIFPVQLKGRLVGAGEHGNGLFCAVIDTISADSSPTRLSTTVTGSSWMIRSSLKMSSSKVQLLPGWQF
jgi:hypothetical protein